MALERTAPMARSDNSKNEAWRNARWIKRVKRADWELFFDACKEVIERFELQADSQLLAMTITEGIRMNIANREALSMHGSLPTLILIMLPNGGRERILGGDASNYFPFQGPQNAEGVRVDPELFRSRWNELSKGLFNSVEELISRRKSSPYAKSHNPDLYRMAIDADFRERALDHLLDGKGEWPGAAGEQPTNYWIFQANPKWYDLAGELGKGTVDHWSISAHAGRIRPGDKVILWQTGPDAGCYALGSVSSMPTPAGDRHRVDLRIELDLHERPILHSAIKDDLPALKIGTQGTAFAATKDEYDHLLKLATERGSEAMHDLNTILYGPPGTGKTFHAVTHAVAIIEQRSVEQITAACSDEAGRRNVRTRFEQYMANGQVRSITFHQSFSYEDFVEGIKPQTDRDNGQVTYSIEAGIFKRASTEAAYEYLRVSLDPEQRDVPFDELFAAYAESVEEKIDADEVVRISTRTGKELQIVDITERGNIKLRHVNHSTSREYIVSLERTRALNAAFDDLNTIDNIDREFRKVIGGSNGTAYWAVLNQVRLFNAAFDKIEGTPEGDLLFEDKLPHVERIDWSDRTLSDQEVKPFVLVIDEINRGNIAGIFGELITLIEPDKRGFCSEAAQAELPYSKTRFAVPPNLYLLGTMNTADRSVEALDTALRRRFSFVEMPSRPDLIEQPGKLEVDLRALLTAINDRIERLLDKDHHIGHSYFMGIHRTTDPERELRSVFKNKVLPLLQEYFYGDPRKLGAVLGREWVKPADKASVKGLVKGFDLDDAEKEVFIVSDPMAVEVSAFTSIYA